MTVNYVGNAEIYIAKKNNNQEGKVRIPSFFFTKENIFILLN